jgi:hypothetical protein
MIRVILVSSAGMFEGVDDGLTVYVGGNDGACHLGIKAVFVDDGTVEDPSIKIWRCSPFVTILNEVG